MDKSTFLRRVNSPFLMGLFLFWKLPSAFFMGIRIVECDGQRSAVRLPYGWRSQNPFRSVYFAAQCAAGELSTGILALSALQGKPPVSMLVTHVEAEFLKKAAEPMLFTCEEGAEVEQLVAQVMESSKGHTLKMLSTGRLPDGTEAARVWITWSFKRKRLLGKK